MLASSIVCSSQACLDIVAEVVESEVELSRWGVELDAGDGDLQWV